MKNSFLFVAVIASLYFAQSLTAQVPSYVPSNGLIGWWPFTGNANDLSGNGNNGTVNGASLTTDRNGSVNCAYSFNGTSNYISCTIALLPTGSSARTISSWFQTTVTTISTNQYPNLQNITGYGANLSGTPIFEQYITGPSGKGYFESGGFQNQAYSLNAVNDGVWHNIVTTYGGPGKRVKLYIDGVVQDSTGLLTLGTANSFFGIGLAPWANNYFKGKIDDIGLWNRALTQDEITSLYQGCSALAISSPVSQSVSAGTNVQFTVSAAASPVTYQWQTDLGTGFQNLNNVTQYSGVTTAALNVANVTGSNHNQLFRCIVTSGSCTYTSAVATLSVNSCNMSILSNPSSQTVVVGSNVQMGVSVSDPLATYQWQTDLGIGFQNLNNATQYSGVTSGTLNIANTMLTNNNQPFRCLINSSACTYTSTTAVLKITDNVSVGIAGSPDKDLFFVYPNPAMNQITLKADARSVGLTYVIYDQTGKVVLNGKLNAESTIITLNELPAGIYSINVGTSSQAFKIIKSAE